MLEIQNVSKTFNAGTVNQKIALNGLNAVVGASFMVEPDPVKAAELIDARIAERRLKLGLSR